MSIYTQLLYTTLFCHWDVQKIKSLTTIFMSIKYFEKIYRKKAATALESAFSTNIKKIREQFIPETFIGHFNKNMFIIVPPIGLNTVLFLKGLKEITLSSESLSLLKQSSFIFLR